MSSLEPFAEIRPPFQPPSEVPDPRSAEEQSVADKMAGLPAKALGIHLSERLLNAVEKERDRLLETKRMLSDRSEELRAAAENMHRRELDLTSEISRLKQSHKSLRWSLGLSSLGLGLGGTLVSLFASGQDTVQWAYLGCGLVVCASIVQLVKTVFDA